MDLQFRKPTAIETKQKTANPRSGQALGDMLQCKPKAPSRP